jgi:membrane carboxypeptidase/penicillin-binding protein
MQLAPATETAVAVELPTRSPRSRVQRWGRRILIGFLALLLACGSAFGLAWVLTPSVGDAQARTAALLRSHGGISDQGVAPALVTKALVATEDSRFYSHSGLDPKGLARGLVSLVTHGSLQGATLDAQLAKLLYADGAPGILEHVQEGVLAVKLDAKYSKQQILAMYLDAAYFGHNAYGVEQAAQTYFGLPADQLSWGQASLLAGLVNAPTAYDPTAHLHLARSRQQHVLARLVATHVLTRQQADAAYAQPLHPAEPFSG